MQDVTPPRNPLGEALRAGQLALAMIIKEVRNANIAEVAKAAGYDAIYVDLEYGVIPEAAAGPMLLGARKVGVTPLVRIPSADPDCARRCLEAGAAGIVVPKIGSLADVRAGAAACAAHAAGGEPAILITMLESPEALELAEPIAAEPGVDVLHIGTTDLSAALGIPNRFTDPRIEAAYARVVAAARRHGRAAGAGGLGSDLEMTRRVIGMGVRFVTGGNEWAFMTAAARERSGLLRSVPLGGVPGA